MHLIYVLLLLSVSLTSMLAGMALVLLWAVPKVEQRFVFRPTRDVFKNPADFGIPFEQVFVDTPDECRLSGWHICPPNPCASVIYFHGNSGNLGLFNEVFKLLYDNRIQVFAIDYRGYGASTGTPSEKGLYQDALAAADYFAGNLKISGLPILYWGRSLGGCFAAYAASRRPPHGLILETTFPSKKSLVKNDLHFRRFQVFSRCRLDTARHLKNHKFPVLLLHGDQDRTVPLEQGRLLFEKLTGPKQFHCIKGADHVNIHRFETSVYMDPILEFAGQLKPGFVN